MKKFILCIIAMLSLCMHSFAQQFKQEGKTFVQQSAVNAANDSVKTEYIYQTKDGVKYTIYLSKTGKAYVWRISKKSGKGYRMYLPEIGKTINPSAYAEKSKKANS